MNIAYRKEEARCITKRLQDNVQAAKGWPQSALNGTVRCNALEEQRKQRVQGGAQNPLEGLSQRQSEVLASKETRIVTP